MPPVEEKAPDEGFVFEDYSSLIPSDPDNLSNEIPHDIPVSPKKSDNEIQAAQRLNLSQRADNNVFVLHILNLHPI